MKIVFWSSFALVVWCYGGYPLLMRLRARLRGSVVERSPADESAPRVSVVIAVRNEELRIAERIENLLSQDYPVELLELIIVCNGCRDRTEEIVAAHARQDGRVRRLISSAGDGKAGAVNAGVAEAQGSIVVFADARQQFRGDAIRHLVNGFGDRSVGGVSGRLVVTAPNAPSLRGVNRYWNQETLLRLAESRTGSVVGATGAIYAIRRDLFEPLPPRLILDDVYLPLRIVARGYRMILEPRAIAVDTPARSQRAEFRRKLRTMVGNIQILRVWPELLVPWKNPVFYRFVSHKVLRLIVPMALLALLFAGSVLEGSLYRGIVLGQLAFYAIGALGLLLPIPLLSLPAAFLLANAAVLCAILRPNLAADTVWKPLSSPQAGTLE